MGSEGQVFARKLLAMYYESFRIAGPAINSMYMAEFNLVAYSTYGDKQVEKCWEIFKKVAMSMAHMITPRCIIEHFVMEFKKPKHLFVDDMRDSCKEKN